MNHRSIPDRRRFLKGMGGATLALPLLEASAADPAQPPMRMVTSAIFYGLVPEFFLPETGGRDYQMPKVLKQLAPHRDDFTIFSGLDHNLGGGHNATKYFLNGIPISHAKGYAEGNISVDQKAALHVSGQTRYPSLVLGCNSGNSHSLSWTKNGSPIPQITKLKDLFNLLFEKPNPRGLKTERRDLEDRNSILDLVLNEAKSFQKGLGKEDTEKLDQYFTSVRDLERRVEQSNEWLDKEKPSVDYQLPDGIDFLSLHDKTPFFYDIMALALQTDSTRVISLSFTDLGKDGGGIPGVKQGYHSLSHHGKEQKTMDELALVESFYVSQFSRFITKLKQIKEPNGQNLLENTMALFGSGMSNGSSHSNRDLPVVLAGGGFQHGQHRIYARDGKQSVALCNLYVTMLQKFGLEIDQFNTSTGGLSELA